MKTPIPPEADAAQPKKTTARKRAAKPSTTEMSDPAEFDMVEMIDRVSVFAAGRPWGELPLHEQFRVLGTVVRLRSAEVAFATRQRIEQSGAKRAFYLSLEFLIGRSLENNLINLGWYEQVETLVKQRGGDLATLLEAEQDAGLGNGGLGRLAACFLDSIATMGLPGFGYGLNYEYGMFRQEIRDGRQFEAPDAWRVRGTPWQVERYEEAVPVQLYGRVVWDPPKDGNPQPRWADAKTVLGVPFDLPIVGYGSKTVNMLRLFSARAQIGFNMQAFDEGAYVEAVQQKDLVETITKVLYPNDSVPQGPELRLVQEYFLTACALRDIVTALDLKDLRQLPQRAAIQLNDTHPSLAVAELMRIMVDENGIAWDDAWKATTQTLAYTNHTLMPEALERWPVALMERVLPRHMQIIYEINARFLKEVAAAHPGDDDRLRRMSLIEEGPQKKVRMAHLAIVGSHSVNGVAKVHTELVKTRLVPDFYQMWPDKFNNKTNGVTPRRWLRDCNAGLAKLITDRIGEGWITDLGQLHKLEPLVADGAFVEQFRAVKQQNKQRLAALIAKTQSIACDPASIFDVQIKRIHEYKRQTLNVLHIVSDYLRITDDKDTTLPPRTYILSGKAAPGYYAAKQIIYLINKLAELINADKRCAGRLRVVFMPDYRVTLAEEIIPAADVSEQISTAGTEASGTSNMKFAMNGALTIGTLDGANIEIADEVGPDNVFIFGNKVEEIQKLQAAGTHPWEFYSRSTRIRRLMDAFKTDRLSPGAPGAFGWVYQKHVENWDPYFHLADLDSYLGAHEQIGKLYADRSGWANKAILNVARMGRFSSDRTIQEYAREVWGISSIG